MAVGFSSYEIARSGLKVSERGLFVTGHNLSNVHTPGFTRQQAIIETNPYITEYGKNGKLFQYGLGADIQETRQIRHTFLDIVYRQENTIQGYWDTRSKAFQDVEAILNDPMGDGLQGVMNKFWDSWQELSKEPESLTARAMVRQRGQELVYYYNHIGNQLDKQQTDLNSEIQVRVNEVNNITSQIAKLNTQIAAQEINGDKANDYRDQRNLLLDRLSILCDAEVNEMQDGQMDVTLGGYYLVTRGQSKNLYVHTNAEDGEFFYPKLEGTDIKVNIKSGILKGLMEARGEVPGIKGSTENGTPNYKADITFAIDVSAGNDFDTLKDSLSTYINELKQSGLDYNIRFITMGSTSSVYAKTYDNSNIDSMLTDLTADNLLEADGTVDGSFKGLIDKLAALNNAPNGFREDAKKYTYVFTNKSINGNSGAADTFIGDAANYVNSLRDMNMKVNVVTDPAYYTNGVPDAASNPEAGWSIITSGTGGSLVDINSDLTGYEGMLKGWNDNLVQTVKDALGNIPPSLNIVSDVKIKLNAMLNRMVNEINALQMSGMTLDGKPGVAFFGVIDSNYPIEMGNLKLSDELLSDNGLNNITASKTTAKGDNTVARQIANLRDVDILVNSTGKVSIDEYYRNLILEIGNGGMEADRIATSQATVVNAVDAQRNAISGVSMDEEMSNMMKYKFAYDASSRVLNIMDSMMETIITSMGKVGR
ncbi:flagellar hook-associated protein FlgK [Clostridium sp. BNL1100]|uniref:flagellar hook-associated protein FlgK n=1 Tax=Clostridium sp. BNL1100 TaxID=755731 RepID=UPI00024A78B2|nr:flagellar hook-associated protein FlgK [Clostridium sp. BNL1100]AEY64382.1 flagellar hook-associated protein FlgK [Clostridium sp. BNL1100]